MLQWDELRVSERAGPKNWYSLNVTSGSTGCTHQQRSEETHINITDLCPGTKYSISVRACNSACGQNSPTLQVQTPEGGE